MDLVNLAEAQPRHEQFFEHARLLRQQGSLEEAACWARKAIWEHPPVANAQDAARLSRFWFLLGSIEFDLSHFGIALDVAGEAIALNSADGQNHALLGMAFARLEIYDRAVNCAEMAVAIAETDPFVQRSASHVFREAKQFDKAIAAAGMAVALAPANAGYRLTLAHAYQYGGRCDIAIEMLRAIVAEEPDNAAWRYCLAAALGEHGDNRAAIAEYETCLALDPAHAAARWNLSHLQLLLGDWKAGYRNHEARFSTHKTIPVETRQPRRFSKPQWTPERTPERVHVHAEQGFGDTLQFCRYLPMIAARGHDVRFEVPANLLRLMKFNFPSVNVHLQAPDWPGCLGVAEFDSHLSLVSAAHVFGTTVDNVPRADGYIYAPLHPSLKFALGSNFKVGLCWFAGRRNTSILAKIGARKSLSFSYMLPLLGIDGIEFHSLQIGGDRPGHSGLIDRTGEIADWADTAGYIANLDLVISADTAVAHLAGAMGKPVWLLNPYETAWRWLLDREDSPWYSSMRIFRQPKIGDWTAVIEQVARALSEERDRT